MPLSSSVHSTSRRSDAGPGSSHARLGRAAVALLLVGGLLCASPWSVAAQVAPAAAPATASTGSTGSGTAGAYGAASLSSQPTIAAAIPSLASTAAPSAAVVTRTFDLYDPRAERWQNPDLKACTAASAPSMLNTIAYSGSASEFVWKPTTSYSTQESILVFERAHMTMLAKSAGTDPHGWRNALNYFGWGSGNAGVYVDASYSSFDAAARAAVSALARTHKPVGILALSGGHAQFITGCKVQGADPGTGSTSFSVLGVYLTDPYQAAGHRNTWITYAQWHAGGTWVRFSQYRQTDSPYRDPIDGHIGKSEWLGKWVIIAPVK